VVFYRKEIKIMMNRIQVLSFIVRLSVIIVGIATFSCSDSQTTQSKISSALQLQINLRKEQIVSPTPDRLAQIKALGMNVANIGIQKIYIYVNQQLTPAQVNRLQTMNVTVYMDSWIPPVGNHPTGYYLAEIPVDKLTILVAEEYVVRLDTAETESEPQLMLPQD
jgi:hypothetical protein